MPTKIFDPDITLTHRTFKTLAIACIATGYVLRAVLIQQGAQVVLGLHLSAPEAAAAAAVVVGLRRFDLHATIWHQTADYQERMFHHIADGPLKPMVGLLVVWLAQWLA